MAESVKTTLPGLSTAREPKRAKSPGTPGSEGDVILKDALLIVALMWAVVAFMYFTLRKYNA